jgi:uncharacterized membrane protein YphA (DoxX/SURF4 family)
MKNNSYIKFIITLLNITVGWHLLFEGLVKMLVPDWSSLSYLQNSTGPLAFVFKAMADSPLILKVVDLLNIYGLMAIGLLLIIGILTRYAAIGGALLLLSYYISNPPLQATGVGFGVEGHYILVNKNLIETILLLMIASLPNDWFYGLQNLISRKSEKSLTEKQPYHPQDVPVVRTMDRREVLKNLIWTPFLAGFFLLALKTKRTGINAISGATNIPKNNIIAKAGAFKPNDPIGKAQGIFPGRVTWIWNPASTNPGCTSISREKGRVDENDDFWFMDKNTNQENVDAMLIAGLCSISGKKEIAKAWDDIFKYYNKKRGKGNVSYQKGEKILIKNNRTSVHGGINPGFARMDLPESLCVETSPQIVLSMLRQLINIAGVPQEALYVGDTMKEMYADEYQKYYAEFPFVNYLSSSSGDMGRYQVKPTSAERIFYSDKRTVMKDAGADKIFDILEEAEYLISLTAMKGHDAAGLSLCTKNHFGSQTRPMALHLHPGLNDNNRIGYGHYRVLVDLMGNKYTGGKNLFYILDALWSVSNWNGHPVKFLTTPFNSHWSSSMFFSLDPVAIESVALDFLRTEFSRPEHNVPHVHSDGVDDYLHQAADSKNWPTGIVYAPNGDDIPLPESLGVHEHWNNSEEKKYSRNLGTETGIELVKIFQNQTT